MEIAVEVLSLDTISSHRGLCIATHIIKYLTIGMFYMNPHHTYIYVQEIDIIFFHIQIENAVKDNE